MRSLKIVITGVFAAGKTSFIRAISGSETLATEHTVTESTERLIKSTTTVALDFSKVALTDDCEIYLFGTPGQERFDFMWEHLSIGCHGYVVLIDSCRPADLEATQRLMARFATLTRAPFIIAANKQDAPTALSLSAIRADLQLPSRIPLLPCIATDNASVKAVLLHLIDEIDRRSTGTATVQ
jgi:hypothetical protein